MDKATRHSLEQGWSRDEELRVAHDEFLTSRELAVGIPSWRALVGEVVHLGYEGSIVCFHLNDGGDLEPGICRRSRIDGKLLAVERAGIWIGPPDESTWTFISFSSITSACLRRPGV